MLTAYDIVFLHHKVSKMVLMSELIMYINLLLCLRTVKEHRVITISIQFKLILYTIL